MDVSGYGVGGDDYAALWVKTVHSPPWQARHGLTSAQYQQIFDQLTAEDFHPVLVNGYPSGGAPRFAAIFHRSQTPAWVARHGLTSAQYQEAFDKYVAMGFVPDWVSGYSENGQDHYAAIWRQLPRLGGWAARHGLTASEYQQFFDTMVSQGFKPQVVSGYDIGGQDHYAAIFRQSPAAGPWQARHGLSSDQYQQTFDQLSVQGYRLEQVNACTVAGQDRFAAIWTK